MTCVIVSPAVPLPSEAVVRQYMARHAAMGAIFFTSCAPLHESYSPHFPFALPTSFETPEYENRFGQDIGAAAKTTWTNPSPYAEFVEILAASILPIFEKFTVSSFPTGPPSALENTPRPSSPGDTGSTATAGGGSSFGGGDVAVDGGSLASDSLASESVAGQSDGGGSDGASSAGKPTGAAAAGSIASDGDEPVTPPQPTELLRVFELETAESSEAEADAEAARLLLPEPATPAPDPKTLAIPAEKVRQQVRRPVPRVRRQPLQTLLEILSALPEDPSSPSSRPGSRTASAKARVESKAKVELDQSRQQLGGATPAQEKDGGGHGEVGRATSGALEGNPYRWVVGSASSAYLLSRSGNLGREGVGMAAGSTHLSDTIVSVPSRIVESAGVSDNLPRLRQQNCLFLSPTEAENPTFFIFRHLQSCYHIRHHHRHALLGRCRHGEVGRHCSSAFMPT